MKTQNEVTFLPHDAALEDEVRNETVVHERTPWEETLASLATRKTNSIAIPRNNKDLRRAQVVDAFLDAFQLIGGVPRLAIWADENPTEFYRLYGKLVPKEEQTKTDTNMTIRHVLPRSALD